MVMGILLPRVDLGTLMVADLKSSGSVQIFQNLFIRRPQEKKLNIPNPFTPPLPSATPCNNHSSQTVLDFTPNAFLKSWPGGTLVPTPGINQASTH